MPSAPESPSDPLDTINVLIKARAFSIAVPMLKRLAREQPNRAAVHFSLGTALSEIKEFPESVMSLTRATDLDPLHAPGWTALGIAYVRILKLPSAREALERSLALEPNNETAHLNMAAVLCDLHDFQPAFRHARHPAVPARHRAPLYFLLAETMFNWVLDSRFDGNSKELLLQADAAYGAFIELFPDSKLTRRALTARIHIGDIILKGGDITDL